MVDIEQDVSPETDAVTEVLDDVSERLYTALPRWFQEHAQLNMEVDGVDITILVNQSWNSGYMAYTMIIRSLNDEEKTHTDAIYSWWQSGPQKRTSGTYSVTVAPKGETGGVNTLLIVSVRIRFQIYVSTRRVTLNRLKPSRFVRA
jgi:hypothetical protein